MTEFASPGPVTSDGLQPTVAAVAKAVADRADELGDALEEAVTRKSALSNVAVVLRRDDVSDAVCRANIRSILAAMVDETQFDSAPATTIGVERARNKTAFSSLLASDRIGFRQLWDIVANVAARHSSINAEALRSLTGRHADADLAIAARLGTHAEPASVETLLALEAGSTDKLVRKEVRRSLYRLEQRGVTIPPAPRLSTVLEVCIWTSTRPRKRARVLNERSNFVRAIPTLWQIPGTISACWPRVKNTWAMRSATFKRPSS